MDFIDIIEGPLKRWLELSQKIGGKVADQSELVQKAFRIELKCLQSVSRTNKPRNINAVIRLFKPLHDIIFQIQDFTNDHSNSKFFYHLSLMSEGINVLGWVIIEPDPCDYILEMEDSLEFFIHNIHKRWRTKENLHVTWIQYWLETFKLLHDFVKLNHPHGLLWGTKIHPTLDSGAGDVSISIKKPTLDTKTVASKTHAEVPLQNIECIVENKKNDNVLIKNVNYNTNIKILNCNNSTLILTEKVSSIVINSCANLTVELVSVLNLVNLTNSENTKLHISGPVPILSMHEIKGCQIYLSRNSLGVEILTSNCLMVSVLIPNCEGIYQESPIPEKFKTTVTFNMKLCTVAVDSTETTNIIQEKNVSTNL